jgi:hypothetical protein
VLPLQARVLSNKLIAMVSQKLGLWSSALQHHKVLQVVTVLEELPASLSAFTMKMKPVSSSKMLVTT